MKVCWVVFFHPGLGRLKHEQTLICLAHGAKINSYCSDENNTGIRRIFKLPSWAVSEELSRQGACGARTEKRGRARSSVRRRQPSRTAAGRLTPGLFSGSFLGMGLTGGAEPKRREELCSVYAQFSECQEPARNPLLRAGKPEA